MPAPIGRKELEGLAMFRGVPFEEVEGYLETAEIEEAGTGDVLIHPGGGHLRMLVLLSGTLEVRLDAPDGVLVSILSRGECAGEMSVFDSEDPSAYVVAREPTQMLVLAPATVLAILQVSHPFALNLLHILSRRVRYSNRVVSSGTRQLQYLTQNASVDTLTGLHNRRWMEEMFTRELYRSHAGSHPLAFLMVDIDFFKRVNDTRGHLCGDRVLAWVARSLQINLRPSDMIVRYGGEEFAVMLPNTSPDFALQVAERLRRGVELGPKEGEIPIEIDPVTVSIGATGRQEGDSLLDLIGRADKALYRAKQAGRNRCLAET